MCVNEGSLQVVDVEVIGNLCLINYPPVISCQVVVVMVISYNKYISGTVLLQA